MTTLQDVDEIQTVTTTATDINERQLIQTNIARRSEVQTYTLTASDVRNRTRKTGSARSELKGC
jgi:hypothetical protein